MVLRIRAGHSGQCYIWKASVVDPALRGWRSILAETGRGKDTSLPTGNSCLGTTHVGPVVTTSTSTYYSIVMCSGTIYFQSGRRHPLLQGKHNSNRASPGAFSMKRASLDEQVPLQSISEPRRVRCAEMIVSTTVSGGSHKSCPELTHGGYRGLDAGAIWCTASQSGSECVVRHVLELHTAAR